MGDGLSRDASGASTSSGATVIPVSLTLVSAGVLLPRRDFLAACSRRDAELGNGGKFNHGQDGKRYVFVFNSEASRLTCLEEINKRGAKHIML